MEKRKNRAMEQLRKPFQGVTNIIRFNWHFYVGVISFCLLIFLINTNFHSPINYLLNLVSLFAITITLITLAVSFYVYDLSGLYKLDWLPNWDDKQNIVNINAGFDETSELLNLKYPYSNLTVLDFYDPTKHTEISIKRARKAYPSYSNTITTKTETLPIETNSVDKVFVIFSAHEIRNENERVEFFNELKRIISNTGEIYVTEHLRDLPNFLAYNIGFMHFLGLGSWYSVFEKSDLKIKNEQKLNPFITNFTLTKYGNTA